MYDFGWSLGSWLVAILHKEIFLDHENPLLCVEVVDLLLLVFVEFDPHGLFDRVYPVFDLSGLLRSLISVKKGIPLLEQN